MKGLFITLAVLCPQCCFAATSADIDKMTTYAVILGRSTACGVDTSDASRKVGRWLDRKFPPGSRDQQTYLPIFSEGMLYHAKQQQAGKSPDNCQGIRRAYSKMRWPE